MIILYVFFRFCQGVKKDCSGIPLWKCVCECSIKFSVLINEVNVNYLYFNCISFNSINNSTLSISSEEINELQFDRQRKDQLNTRDCSQQDKRGHPFAMVFYVLEKEETWHGEGC